MISDLGLAYSLRLAIEAELDVPAHIKNDGFRYPDDKPFILIESMQNNNQQISKMRETINTIFRYQVGIFAEYSYKRSEYQSQLRRLFLFDEIPYYDENGIITERTFVIESGFNEVPIPNDDLTDSTKSHRTYFDIEINIKTHKNRGGI